MILLTERPNLEPIITLKNISFGYTKDTLIYENVNIEINSGEILGIVGKSGIGKTTLAYLLKGIIPHSIRGYLSGEIVVDGMKTTKTKLAHLSHSIGMVFQDLNAQLFNNTVLEEVQFGLKNFKLDPHLAFEALSQLNILELKDKIPMNLSAGQKQRVILASVLALQPKILILDEPSIHLDYSNKLALKEWLIQIHQKTNMTILIASNDPWLIGQICSEILFIDDRTLQRKKKTDLMKKMPLWMWSFND